MMVYIPAMTLKAIHCHHYMPSGVANELQVVVSFFCHIVICFWIFFWSTPTASPSQPNPASLATSSLQVARVASWSTGAIGNGWGRRMDSRPIGVLGPIFAISVMPNRQKIHADGLGFWGCISIKFILEPLSLWICFLRLCVFQPVYF